MPKTKVTPAAATVVDPATLTPVQMIALSCALGSTDVTSAKQSLPDNCNMPVDFMVRITGNVAKGQTTEDSTTERPAVASDAMPQLLTINRVCAVLKSAGVGAARLRRALAETSGAEETIDPKRQAVFDQAAAELAKTFNVSSTTKGKSGSVTTTATVSLVE